MYIAMFLLGGLALAGIGAYVVWSYSVDKMIRSKWEDRRRA